MTEEYSPEDPSLLADAKRLRALETPKLTEVLNELPERAKQLPFERAVRDELWAEFRERIRSLPPKEQQELKTLVATLVDLGEPLCRAHRVAKETLLEGGD